MNPNWFRVPPEKNVTQGQERLPRRSKGIGIRNYSDSNPGPWIQTRSVVPDGWRDRDFSPRALHLACLKAYRIRVCQCAMVPDSAWWGGLSLSGLAYQVAWKFRNQMYQSPLNLQRSRGGDRLNQ